MVESPLEAQNLFRSVRDFWIPKILQQNLHKKLTAHFIQKKTDPPFSDDLVNEFRQSLDSLLPLSQPLDWQIRADQPLCLHALAQMGRYMNDPDVHLFEALIAGVSTGVKESIRPSHVFATKTDAVEVTRELVQEEIDKGWIHCFPGSLEEAKLQWPHGVAMGKLGVALSESRPPRLVVDYIVCGTNPNSEIKEHQQLPSAKDVMRCFPLHAQSEELGALGLDAKSAHKLCVIKETHRGLVGFSLDNKLYF